MFFVAGVIMASCGIPAWADTFLFGLTSNQVVSLVTNVGTFTTAMSQFTPGVNNSGWWSATASNINTNDNYLVGTIVGGSFNDFFTFAIPQGVGVITSATLSAPRGNTAGVPFTFSLFDVSTDAATLNNNTGTSAAIFNDLGSGVLYGSALITDLNLPNPLTVSLDAEALAALNGARGSFFSIGGTLTPSSVPEPRSVVLLASLLLAFAPLRKLARR